MTTLSAFSTPGHFFKGNIHTHTNRSDGVLTPEETVYRYKSEGYDFVAITDHFLETFRFPITDTRQYRDERFTTLLGAELHAPRIEMCPKWHIVGVGLPLDFAPPSSQENGPAIAKRAYNAGAFVGLAHPAWYQLSLAEAQTVAPYAHAVEIYNHGCHVIHDRGDGAYMLDGLSDKGCHLLTYACDDAHFRYPDFFQAWIEVKAESLSPEALLTALKCGNFYSTQGPEIHNVELHQDKVLVECSASYSVLVTGRGSLYSVCFDRGKTRYEIPLKGVAHSPWLRITVTDEAGKRAWTNPFWLENMS